MNGCDRCDLGEGFLFRCEDCGGQFCGEHHDSDKHHCSLFGEFYSEGDPMAGSSTDQKLSTGRYMNTARMVAPAGIWILSVLVIHQLDLHPGSWGMVTIAVAGSIALWNTAISIPTVNEWMYSGG